MHEYIDIYIQKYLYIYITCILRMYMYILIYCAPKQKPEKSDVDGSTDRQPYRVRCAGRPLRAAGEKSQYLSITAGEHKLAKFNATRFTEPTWNAK